MLMLLLILVTKILQIIKQFVVLYAGILDIYPRAINSIPSAAHVEIGEKSMPRCFFYIFQILHFPHFHLISDVRDIDEERRNGVIKNIKSSALEIAEKRGVLLEFNIVNQDPPAECSDLVIKSIESASKQLGLNYKHMISRAYHDALFMARFVYSEI